MSHSSRANGGWRRYSPPTLYNDFVDLGWDEDWWGVNLKLVGADSDLTGNGSAPVSPQALGSPITSSSPGKVVLGLGYAAVFGRFLRP